MTLQEDPVVEVFPESFRRFVPGSAAVTAALGRHLRHPRPEEQPREQRSFQ